jgi:hypothetical protein
MTTLNLVQDDNGITITGTVRDDGVGRSLAAATVAVILRTSVTTHTVSGTPDPDQGANPGRFTAVLTATHLATADVGALLEVQVTDGSQVITYPAAAAQRVRIRADLS